MLPRVLKYSGASFWDLRKDNVMDWDEMKGAYMRATQDDIVTRLRENCDETDCVNVRSIALVKCDNCEAADEIERLQTQLKQWQALCDTYYHKLALEPDNTFYFISGYRFLAQGGK